MLKPTAAWNVERAGQPAAVLDARVLGLLRGIADLQSLAAAAREAGVPYRSAWAVLEGAASQLGTPLAELTRGRGAILTPLGQRLVAGDDQLRHVVAQRVHVIELDRDARPARRAQPLRVAASHDIALAQLKDRWRLSHGVALEFHGSAESLDAFRAGAVDVAGFHVVKGATRAGDPLLARLDRTRDVLIRFMTREQGLIVGRGNPLRVRDVSDLGDGALVLVNRQPGSGTRLLLDRLLARAGVDPAGIPGYGNEEFTHAAVAATVAAGKADVGFGIRAAAAQFGLAFVPVATERYLFACRRRMLDRKALHTFRALLTDAATRAVIRPLPGYALDRPGELASGRP